MAERVFVEVAHESMTKLGETLCGDKIKVARCEDSTLVILADGLGSGAKANLLASLTVSMAAAMRKEGSSVDEILEAMADTLPLCQVRKLAYSTLTIAQVYDDGRVYLAEYDNPLVMVGKGDKIRSIERKQRQVGERIVREACFRVEEGEWLALLSDGILHAGIGGLCQLGWGWERAESYLRNIMGMEISAEEGVADMLSLCNRLYEGKPGDDASVAVIKVRRPRVLTALVGPPARSEQDTLVVDRLLSYPGQKVVCGGSTGNLVARQLGSKLEVDLSSMTADVPPLAHLEGVDLCTEGMLTLMKAKRLLANATAEQLRGEQDGASRLASALLASDEVHFIVGRAINSAHQSSDLPMELAWKGKMVEDVVELLRGKGIEVSVEYY